jgi:hypothetical protein
MIMEVIRTRAPREGGKQRRARAILKAEAGESCIAELPPSEAVVKKVVVMEEAPWVKTAAVEAALAKALAEAPEPIVAREVAVPWWRVAATPLERERPQWEAPEGNAWRRERAMERRQLLVGIVELDSTLLDAVPEDEELEYV